MLILLRIALMIGLVLPSVVLLSCGSEKESTNWRVNEDGYFTTRDIERARQEVPFMVLPEYLPPDSKEYPWIDPIITGPLRGTPTPDGVHVDIHYYRIDESNNQFAVLVRETDPPPDPIDPALDPDYNYTEIAGVQIVETTHVLPPSSTGERPPAPGFLFYWTQDDILIEVGVYGYDYEEAVKVVQSMILAQ